MNKYSIAIIAIFTSIIVIGTTLITLFIVHITKDGFTVINGSNYTFAHPSSRSISVDLKSFVGSSPNVSSGFIQYFLHGKSLVVVSNHPSNQQELVTVNENDVLIFYCTLKNISNILSISLERYPSNILIFINIRSEMQLHWEYQKIQSRQVRIDTYKTLSNFKAKYSSSYIQYTFIDEPWNTLSYSTIGYEL